MTAFDQAWDVVKEDENAVRCACGNMESPDCILEGSNCEDASCSECCNCYDEGITAEMRNAGMVR